jgi:hypothetical protein
LPRVGVRGPEKRADLRQWIACGSARGPERHAHDHGEPANGKDSAAAVRGAAGSGLLLAQIAEVQAEMELPLAGIRRLCAPMFDRLAVRPPPHRNALGVALGLRPGDPPDRFLIALAVLSLLCAQSQTSGHFSARWMTRRASTPPRREA